MDSNVINDETISRFILSRSHIRYSTGEAKYGAYLPMFNEGDDNWETSVFRITELQDQEVWHIGEVNVAQVRSKTLLGRSDLAVLQVRNTNKLNVESAEPPDRHAVIVGWPAEKYDQIELAKYLAEEAGQFKQK